MANTLYHIQEERRAKRKNQAGKIGRFFKLSPWNMILVGAYGLVGMSLYFLLSIYLPVFRVEATYQSKNVVQRVQQSRFGVLQMLTPSISLNAIPRSIVEGYGIVIPKLFIQEQVVMNVDPNDKRLYMPALREGIAHAAGTSFPGDGGLGYYFAHSSGLDAPMHGGRAVFYLLGKLREGDEVRIYRAGEKFSYRVVKTEVVNAEDVAFLEEEREVEQIVLQTCWPIGTSSKRLLVTAERV
jgi:LPXTG-site transpeptidase (sortase) family protein